jgi:hypothetical protein
MLRAVLGALVGAFTTILNPRNQSLKRNLDGKGGEHPKRLDRIN